MGAKDLLVFFIPTLDIDLNEETDLVLKFPAKFAYIFNIGHYDAVDSDDNSFDCSRII
jgi:hypothetical protein